MSGLMSSAHKEIIDVKLRTRFIRELMLDAEFFAVMRYDHCITETMLEQVEIKLRNSGRQEAVSEFLTRLKTRPEKAFKQFVKALIETKQEFLAEEIDHKLIAIGEDPLSPEIKNAPQADHAAPGDSVDTVSEIQKIVSYVENKDDLSKLSIQSMSVDKQISLRQSQNCYLPRGTSGQRGRVIIINNENFSKHDNRPGSEVDVMNLKSLFDQFKFEVISELNKTAQEIENILKRESGREDLKDIDVLIVVLMSHGQQNVIFGADGKPVNILPDITDYFSNENCPHMIDKPKLFIIQACQKIGKDPVKLDPEAFKNPDTYIAMSVVSGDVSHRYRSAGGWFIRATVCAIAWHSHYREFCHLMTMVRDAVQKVKREGHPEIQLPCELNNLKKDCYLIH